VSVVDYGAFVHIRDGVEGHIPQGDIVVAKGESDEEPTLHIGDEIEAEIANIDSQERRITLTMRTGETTAPAPTASGESKPAAQRPSKTPKKSAAAEAAGGTIGELIKQKLGAKLAAIGDKKDEDSGEE
jgi:small subunit ribosomal protein S1